MNASDGVHALGRRIRERQDELLEEGTGDETMRQRIAKHAALPRASSSTIGRRLRPFIWVAAVLTAGIILATGAVKWRDGQRLTFTVGEPPAHGRLGELISARSDQALPVRFSEGTTMVLRPGARGRVTAVGPKGADVILESGRARIEIAPHPRSDWSVRIGPFEVRVTGTKFETAYDPQADEFLLELEEGRVIVSGCDFEGRTLSAGEHLKASCMPQPRATLPPAQSDMPAPVDSAMSSGESSAEPAATSRWDAVRTGGREPRHVGARAAPNAEAKSWVELARHGHYDDAYELVREDFEEECRHRGAAELWLLGDVARLSGHASKARRAYIALRDRFPGTPESGDAAFALGRLAVQAEGDRLASRRWFETHLRERPDGPLASAALGRLMELQIELADRPGAESIAREYLRRFPEGPHASEAERLLGSRGQGQR